MLELQVRRSAGKGRVWYIFQFYPSFKAPTITKYVDMTDIFLNHFYIAIMWLCDQEATVCIKSSLTLDLRQAPLLLLRVLSDPPQVVQLCLQELALPSSLQPQVALLGKLRLQLVDTPPQRLTQATTLTRDEEGGGQKNLMKQRNWDRYGVGEKLMKTWHLQE